MVIIEEVMGKALEQAFSRALEQLVQNKAEELFKQAFQANSPFAQRLEEKLQEGFQRFFENGIRWEKKRAGFKK
jgi:flagellar biosynthesis/type III secretory pathway protein FliH